MANKKIKPERVAKLMRPEKHSYRMQRTIKFDGVLLVKGQEISFADKDIEHLFLKNNYIK